MTEWSLWQLDIKPCDPIWQLFACSVMDYSDVVPFSTSPKIDEKEIVQDFSEESCLYHESIVY